MSDILLFRSNHPNIQSKFINQLEREFSHIVQLLYTTNVPNALLEREVLPYIAKNILFKDPCQEANGKELYRVGMKGFHNLFHFTFDTLQLNIKLNDDGKTGRCIVDGIMNVKQFSWIYTYPLRSILIFEFRLLNNQSIDEPQFEIFRHEEMWSFSDMIDGIPGIGWFYKNIFRWGFGYLFVGISALSCFLHDSLIQSTKKKE
ncbi:unnamed protein product [Adineta steineri]|uniref:Uncharacterized protein n=1 Tax=Adineta steineri TaxID=433720 RepID=A0A815YY33_9BILA|nr:unnamed protein product [Adineta steineri]CAF1576414.1 unnamed protein product [Adineta steineri]